MRRRNWTVPYALFLLVFVIVPLLLIVLYAFTDDGGAFTLANFRKFMMHPEAMNTFVYSIGSPRWSACCWAIRQRIS